MIARIGQRGRYFDNNCAETPLVVRTIIAAAIHLIEASTEEIATAWVASIGTVTCS